MGKLVEDLRSGIVGGGAFYLVCAVPGVALALWGRAVARWSAPVTVLVAIAAAAALVWLAVGVRLWWVFRPRQSVSPPQVASADAGAIIAQHLVSDARETREANRALEELVRREQAERDALEEELLAERRRATQQEEAFKSAARKDQRHFDQAITMVRDALAKYEEANSAISAISRALLDPPSSTMGLLANLLGGEKEPAEERKTADAKIAKVQEIVSGYYGPPDPAAFAAALGSVGTLRSALGVSPTRPLLPPAPGAGDHS